MRKISVIVLCLLFVGFLNAQGNSKVIREKLEIKKALGSQNSLSDSLPAYTQATKGDKSRILMLTSYVTDDYGEIMHCLELSSTETISFWAEFTTIFKTDVRFHFIWTGPEFYFHETDWYSVNYDEYYYFSVDTTTDWFKGVYKLIIIAEQSVPGGGAHSVIECNIKFY